MLPSHEYAPLISTHPVGRERITTTPVNSARQQTSLSDTGTRGRPQYQPRDSYCNQTPILPYRPTLDTLTNYDYNYSYNNYEISRAPHTIGDVKRIIMAINYLILLSRQGKVRLAKWFTTLSPKDKAKIVKDVSQLVLARRTRMCNFLEYKDTKIVYRRYASLFFIAGCSSDDNELITLEIIHRYVEQMDKYYGNVCELDIIFSFTKAYYILDEILLAGELQESSKKNVLRCIGQQDSLEDLEVDDEVTRIM
ncbi:hypothetical protein EKO27_g758 [Xylaria grammica]|uniref:AP-1 complex subunit sigma-1 n=1 Tax=Xylaria grammica TaxID=363999 RepID=A0A439DIZ2_9PEZI|nr:hypothetical protein EKO27_g758 [Xylaria grammica]